MTVVSLGDRLVKVTLIGRLDTQSVGRVEVPFLAHLVPGPNNAIIDLSGVDFVASMGIRMLVSAAKTLRTHKRSWPFTERRPRCFIYWKRCPSSRIVPICLTEAEALATVAPAE